jgi:hypothetical protein
MAMVEGRPHEDEDQDGWRHRGRVQAQGGGAEESEKWEQNEPPTESEMLGKSDSLEAKLTRSQANDRAEPFERLRDFMRRAVKHGGVGPTTKSFRKKGSRDIRVDLEVIKGLACVADRAGGEWGYG